MMTQKKTLFPCSLLVVLVLTGIASAKQDDGKFLDDLKPVLDCQTIALVHIQLSDLSIKESCEQLVEVIEKLPEKNKAASLQQAAFMEQYKEKLMKRGATDVALLHRIGTAIDRNRLIVVRCADESKTKEVKKFLEEYHIGGFYFAKPLGNLVLLGWDEAFSKIPRLDDAELGLLKAALKHAGNKPVRLAMTLSGDQKKALAQGDPKTWEDGSPAGIGNLHWVAVGLDIVGKEFKMSLRASEDAAATAMAAKTSSSLERFVAANGIKKNLPAISNWIEDLELPVSKDTIELSFKGEQFDTMVQAFSQAIVQVLKRQRYSEESVRIRQVAMAFLKYEEANGTFPPPYSVDAEGKPLHSWRVLILPYMEQRNLFSLFRMDQPWDSDANLAAAKNLPVQYAVGEAKIVDDVLHTRVLAMVGDDSAIRSRKTKFQQIVDGSVSTISVAMGSEEQAVPWTKPADLQGTPDELSKKMLEANPDGFWVATCDSGVHFVPPKANAEKLAWALQIDDGNIITANGDNLAKALASPDTPDPLYDPNAIVPKWWTDYLIPVPWIEASGLSQ